MGWWTISIWLLSISDQLRRIAMTLDELKVKVDNQTTVIGSVKTLLTNLSQRLKDAATDPAKVQAIADEISANSQDLADAVVSNTPAE
jgi:uncharacterized coiled-coil protein SlyX